MASTTHVYNAKLVERIKPQRDQVLIEKIVETVTKSGIVLPHAGGKNDVPTERGTILAVGPGVWETGHFVAVTLEAGQEVMFHAYPAGCEIKENGKEYTLIAARQVVAVLE
jgi:chaperonin GroES